MRIAVTNEGGIKIGGPRLAARRTRVFYPEKILEQGFFVLPPLLPNFRSLISRFSDRIRLDFAQKPLQIRVKIKKVKAMG